MRILYFTHSLRSCWNHGNAHFLRGVLRELMDLGHEVTSAEPANSWSYAHLVKDHGSAGIAPFREAYPELTCATYEEIDAALDLLNGMDLVLVHEWNDPELVARIGRRRAQGGSFQLLFHDTHHRAVSDPAAMKAFDLSAYDGVLAFGQALTAVYERHGWGRRVFTWHEAADERIFRPLEGARTGCVWIGNWGDGERTDELQTFLLRPMQACGVPLDVYGVRYPQDALERLAVSGARYRGWIANAQVPKVFAQHAFTVHVPRRYYTQILPGIPTIRIFEALACGIPLISAPWNDAERLFEPGEDFLMARDGDAMRIQIERLLREPALRQHLAERGRRTILARHTCRHRAEELMTIVSSFTSKRREGVAV